jgi:hypothetical protein
MAYYTYKQVRDLIPTEFQKAYEKKMKVQGLEYDGYLIYDGDMWELTAEYIEFLMERIESLERSLERAQIRSNY